MEEQGKLGSSKVGSGIIWSENDGTRIKYRFRRVHGWKDRVRDGHRDVRMNEIKFSI